VTSDLDCVAIMPHHDLTAIAGRGSPLAEKHKVHLQYIPVNTMPEDYEARLTELFPGRLKNLRICVPDPYDLILSKLERNSPKDREDVEYLANKLRLDPRVLGERYEREQRPNLSNESRHDLTLKLWLDLFPPPAQSPA
jgi:Nucleotidyltransferase of unknown function (DUF6036)